MRYFIGCNASTGDNFVTALTLPCFKCGNENVMLKKPDFNG